ncbi:MAG: hypothetical protein H6912_04870 [Kordiimonadaceae bacterium]|nr:hypothetical protein [Kordiimonadaceae bacterium]
MTLRMVLRRKYLFIMTLIAILINSFLPFYAIASLSTIQAAQQNEVPSFLDEKILICTGDSFKWVTWEELQNIDTSKSSTGHFKCPLCYVLAHGQSAILEPNYAPLFNVPVKSLVRPKITSTVIFIDKLLFSGHFSRAPPFFFNFNL